MIGFYFDSGLTKAVTSTAPKRFLLQPGGDAQCSSLFLGDPYNATLEVASAAGATILTVDQTFEFPSSGSAVITQNGVDTMTVSYTGTTSQGLTGVTGLTAAISVGDIIRPNIVWNTRGNLIFFSQGADLGAGVLVALGQPASSSAFSWQTNFGVAGGPLITAITQIANGVANGVRLDLQVSSRLNTVSEMSDWQILSSSFFSAQAGSNSTISANTPAHVPVAPGYALVQNQALPQSTRLLPSNRQVTGVTPGFVIGSYTWRDETTVSAAAIVPTSWDANVTSIGIEKFISGIGCNNDLEPLGLTQPEDSDSIFLNIQDGTYFDGPARFFLPGTQKLEFQPAYSTTHVLAATPQRFAPIFVGTWSRDTDGFYSVYTSYRYQAGPSFSGTDLQFQFNRQTNTITLNQPLAQMTVFLGTLSGSGTDYFDMPVYPVATVQRVYVDHGLVLGQSGCSNFSLNSDEGTLVVTGAAGAKGEPVYATCDPAIAIQYETAAGSTRQLPVDLNPANSGLSGGFVYLRHRRPEVMSVTLSCDKPLIDVPATYSSVIDLVAYGPIYFDGDYALINATVYGPVGGETVAGVDMQVIVDPTQWSGQINYQDPSKETVIVRTGADGTTSMVFIPQPDWGLYIPTTAASVALGGLKTTILTNDTIVLPEPIPISQIFDGTNWIATLYLVFDNDPFFGMIGANTANGEIPWATSGVPGTPTYKTNGMRVVWGASSNNPYFPVQALDANGNNYTSNNFSGQVTSLVYSQSLPVTSVTGAFFITFLQRLTLQLQVVGSDVQSNIILLQMETPPSINDDVWLTLNSATNGQLNTFRLGFTPSAS